MKDDWLAQQEEDEQKENEWEQWKQETGEWREDAQEKKRYLQSLDRDRARKYQQHKTLPNYNADPVEVTGQTT